MKALTRLGLRLATLSRKRDHCKTSSPSRLATLAPLDEEVLGGLILRCEGEARASPRPHPEVRGRSPSLEGRGRLLRNDPASGRGKKPLDRLRERVPSVSEAGEGLPILAQKPDLRLSVAPLIDEGEAVGRFERIARLAFDHRHRFRRDPAARIERRQRRRT